MSIVEALKKGFGIFLMSMGISSPAKKPRPAAAPPANPEGGK